MLQPPGTFAFVVREGGTISPAEKAEMLPEPELRSRVVLEWALIYRYCSEKHTNLAQYIGLCKTLRLRFRHSCL